jgi:hypothetical protein
MLTNAEIVEVFRRCGMEPTPTVMELARELVAECAKRAEKPSAE